jgi:hypothetical protein
MQQDIPIQTERKRRSRVYGVFPTYSLRGYYKDYAREVDREELLWMYLGERGDKTWILWNLSRSLISTPWGLQILTSTRFGGLDVEIAQESEKEATGERGARLKTEWRRNKGFHRGQRLLYFYNPESPGQVRSIWETRSVRPPPRILRSLWNQQADFQGIWFWMDLEGFLCDKCEPEQYQHLGLATSKQREQ